MERKELVEGFSVGLLTHKQDRKLVATMTSVLLMKGVREIIVIDNGIGRMIPQEFWSLVEVAKMSGVRFKYVAECVTLSVGRRKLWEMATEKAILLLDDDMVYPAEFGLNQLECLNEGFDGVVGPSTYVVGIAGLTLEDVATFNKILPASHCMTEQTLMTSPIGGTFMLRTNLPARIFEWADNYSGLGDDKMLGLTMLQMGHKIYFTKKHMVFHLRDEVRLYAGGESVLEAFKREYGLGAKV